MRLPRIISLLAVLIVSVLFAQTGWAAPSLSLGTASGTPGQTVDIPVNFTNDGTVVALQFDVQYDTAQLSAGTPTAGTALGSNGLASSEVAAGTLRVVITPTAGNAVMASGEIATLPFTIAAAATAGNQTLSISNVVMSDAVSVTVTPTSLSNGAVTIDYLLSISTAGTGTGTVSGGGTYTGGTTATVSATADSGSTFTGWSGPDAAECGTGSVVMDADKYCTATFTLNSTTMWTSGYPSPNPVLTGQQVDYGVTVSSVTPSGNDYGSVVFKRDGTVLGTVTLDSSLCSSANGLYTCIPTWQETAPAAGTYTLTAEYSGNADTEGSVGTATLTVNPKVTSTTAWAGGSPSPNPVRTGKQVGYSITVSGITPSGSDYGSVAFKRDGSTLGTVTLDSSLCSSVSGFYTCTPTWQETAPAAGTYTVTAEYSGNASTEGSVSATATLTVLAKVTSTTAWTSGYPSPNPVVTNQYVTYRATVSGVINFTGSDNGSVVFKRDGSTVGSYTISQSACSPSGGGLYTCTTPEWPEIAPAAGTYTLTAEYSGNADTEGSVGTATLTVNPKVTSTTVWTSGYPSPNPVVTGQGVGYGVTVSGIKSYGGWGSVVFKRDGSAVGEVTIDSSVCTSSNGFDTCTPTWQDTAPFAGTYTLTAEYSGTASTEGSVSGSATLTVNPKVISATAWTSGYPSPNPVLAGQQVAYGVTITGIEWSNSGGYGSVVFKRDGSTVGGYAISQSECSPSGGGLYTCTPSLGETAPSAGTYTLTAEYLGNASTEGSVSGTATLTVNPKVTSTTAWISGYPTPNPVLTGQGMAYDVTVTGIKWSNSGGYGSVVFKRDGSAFGTATIISINCSLSGGDLYTCYAPLTGTAPAAGTYTVTAEYSGNASTQASVSPAVTLTVTDPQASTTTWSSGYPNPNPAVTGQGVAYGVMVSGIVRDGLYYYGSVAFKRDGSTLATLTLNNTECSPANGLYTCTLTWQNMAPSAGTYTLTAEYSGNGNTRPSTSTAVTLTVNPNPNTYTVTPTANAHGGITPSTPQTVGYGGTTAFTVTPDTGYGVTVGGNCGGGTLTGNTYTTAAISDDCSVVVSFVPLIVTPTAVGPGSITPSAPQTVNYGDTVMYTLTSNSGYDIELGGTCGGTMMDNSGAFTYTTKAVTGPCTVNVVFNRIALPAAGQIGGSGGGTISSANAKIDSGVFGQQTVGSGSSAHYRILYGGVIFLPGSF